MAKTLTSANCVIMLGITGIFTVPQQLQGFEVDDIFSMGSVKSVETKMGVDGKLSAGWVPTEKTMGITLQADSDSNDLFEAWWQTQEAARETFPAFGVISIPSLSQSYALTTGYLGDYNPIPDAKKIMQARKYSIVWGTILGSPI